jgi:hypothetical protein
LSTRKKKKKKKKKDDALFYRPDPAHALRRDRARASHPSGPKNQKKKKKKNWQTKEIFSRPRNKRKSLPTKHKRNGKKQTKKTNEKKLNYYLPPILSFFLLIPIKSSLVDRYPFLFFSSPLFNPSSFSFFFHFLRVEEEEEKRDNDKSIAGRDGRERAHDLASGEKRGARMAKKMPKKASPCSSVLLPLQRERD